MLDVRKLKSVKHDDPVLPLSRLEGAHYLAKDSGKAEEKGGRVAAERRFAITYDTNIPPKTGFLSFLPFFPPPLV